MAVGRRCDLGCESWPDKAIFYTCPVCGEKTYRYPNLEPMPEDEANQVILRAQFERYYARYCAIKKQPVEGPLEGSETC